MELTLPLSEATECLNYINLQIDGFTAGFGRVFPLDLQHLVAEWIINDPDLLLVLSTVEECETRVLLCIVLIIKKSTSNFYYVLFPKVKQNVLVLHVKVAMVVPLQQQTRAQLPVALVHNTARVGLDG